MTTTRNTTSTMTIDGGRVSYIELAQVLMHCALAKYKVVHTKVSIISNCIVVTRFHSKMPLFSAKCRTTAFNKRARSSRHSVSLTRSRVPRRKLLYIFMNEKRYLLKLMNEICLIPRERPAPMYTIPFYLTKICIETPEERGRKGVVDIFITKLIQI